MNNKIHRWLACCFLFSNGILFVNMAHAAAESSYFGQLRSGANGKCLQAQVTKVNGIASNLLVDCVEEDPKQIFNFDNGVLKDTFGNCLSSRNPQNFFPDGACSNEVWQFNSASQQLHNNANQCLYMAADALAIRQCSNTPVEALETWQPLLVLNPKLMPPVIRSVQTGLCLGIYDVTLPNDTRLFDPRLEACTGNANQVFAYNNNQVTNAKGQCLGTAGTNLVFDACSPDSKFTWTFVDVINPLNTSISVKMLKNSAAGQCLEYSGLVNTGPIAKPDNTSLLKLNSCTIKFPSRVFVEDRWSFFAGTPITPSPPANNLLAKNDSYGRAANAFYNLAFDIPAIKGVRANDTPSGWPAGLTFELVDPIKRTAGTGIALPYLEFRDTGGFFAMIQSKESSLKKRQIDKRGSYQFTYRMVMNGQKSAPATVTLNVF